MKTKLTNLAPAFALGAVLTISALAQEKVAPGFTAEQLTEPTLHRRAMEAVIWGMPAVNAELMFQAMKDAQADFNQVAAAQLEKPDPDSESGYDLRLPLL